MRIKDQTESVRSKALEKVAHPPKNRSMAITKVRHLPQDLEVQGREAFFAWFLPSNGSGWDFLNQYAKSSSAAPEQLRLSLDAVGLAFLSHQASSPMAKERARQKYGEAMKKINRSLRDPVSAKKKSTLQGALLLDLFEKILQPEADTQPSTYAHAGGALALVKHRGITQFRGTEDLKVLIGLALIVTMTSFNQGRPTPDYVWDIRKYCAQYIDTSNPRWRLGGLMAEVTDLAANMLAGRMTSEERVSKSIGLDQKFKALDIESRPTWSYERCFISRIEGAIIVPEGFPLVYDVYSHRVFAQTRQNLMLTRILLAEEIINSCATSHHPERFRQSEQAKSRILDLSQHICASVPHMTDCDFAARHRLPPASHFATGSQHTHTVTHLSDVYTCIFTLLLMAAARHCPPAAYDWAVKQLHLIADHFGLKEAAINLDLLKQQERAQQKQDSTEPRYVLYDPAWTITSLSIQTKSSNSWRRIYASANALNHLVFKITTMLKKPSWKAVRRHHKALVSLFAQNLFPSKSCLLRFCSVFVSPFTYRSLS